MPLIAQSDVSLDINMPGINLHLGDQDKRGYYWDGYDWQPPQWWKDHRGAHIGERNERGYSGMEAVGRNRKYNKGVIRFVSKTVVMA